MDRRVKIHIREAVAIISLAAAAQPANAAPSPDPGFNAELRRRLAAALEIVLADAAVRAIVLRAGAGGWPAAAVPLGEWDDAAADAGISALAARVAGASKPVVIALGGSVQGGALALALAAGWRLAAAGTRLVLPEPALGALPGGDVLWRLARLGGAAVALRLATASRGMAADKAARAGLIDGVVEAGDAGAAASSVAHALAANAAGAVLPAGMAAPPPRRAADAGLRDSAAYLAAIAEARQLQVPPPWQAPRARLIDCVEAALLLPEATAREFVEVARDELARAPLCRALNRLAASRRRAAAGLAGVAPVPHDAGLQLAAWCGGAEDFDEDTETLADVVAALMRGGFGGALRLAAPDARALAGGLRAVAQAQGDAGAGSDDAVGPPGPAPAARLGTGLGARALAESRLLLVPRAAAADPDVTAALAEARAAGATVVWLGGLASTAAVPDAGLSVVTPGLAELAFGSAAATAPLAPLAAALSTSGVLCLRAGEAAGGITGRLVARLHASAERAVLAGATPAAVDAALRGIGLAEPPFQRADRIGPGAVAAGLRAFGQQPGALTLLLAASDPGAGIPGNFYRPGAGGAPQPDPTTEALLPLLRAELGLVPEALDAEAIRARVLAELADEGAALLQEAQAFRAGDIDLAAVLGLGLGRVTGGPMCHADACGPLATRALLRGLADSGAPAPAALWDVLIRNGRHFADLDTAPQPLPQL